MHKEIEKLRITLYITKSCMEKLNKMCAQNLVNGESMGRSKVVCEAIEMFYKTVKK